LNLARTVLEDPKLSAMRVILLTTLAERGEHHVQQLIGRHARLDVLVKPVHRRILRESLRGLFSIWRVRARPRTAGSPVSRTGSGESAGVCCWSKITKSTRLLPAECSINLAIRLKPSVMAEQRWRCWRGKTFDLILMDCMMPEVDGFETTRAIRTREEGTDRHVPIVAMTANTMEGAEARCMAAGMDDYMASRFILRILKPSSVTGCAMTRLIPRKRKTHHESSCGCAWRYRTGRWSGAGPIAAA
jgi:CheY-like chemotaxis protein